MPADGAAAAANGEAPPAKRKRRSRRAGGAGRGCAAAASSISCRLWRGGASGEGFVRCRCVRKVPGRPNSKLSPAFPRAARVREGPLAWRRIRSQAAEPSSALKSCPPPLLRRWEEPGAPAPAAPAAVMAAAAAAPGGEEGGEGGTDNSKALALMPTEVILCNGYKVGVFCSVFVVVSSLYASPDWDNPLRAHCG